jgi:tryptophanyl-tRNA synthetase
MQKSVLSCIQPTGDMHIGNYFGAVHNWVQLQANYQCMYGVVDNHAMTMPYNAAQLREGTWKMVFYLLACGIRPENLFIQSLVPEHIELSWTLSCVTSYGDLTRMTQFKDKADQLHEKDKEAFVSLGLFSYPVLQAADILIYRADFVPVGKDQEQHLELTRTIAERFNRNFKTDLLIPPQALFTATPKILSTADPLRKMSKSLGEKHYINVFGDLERIKKQIKSAVTDTGESGPEMSAGVKNLFEIIRACDQNAVADGLMADYQANSLKYSDLKEATSQALISFLTPIQERHAALQADKRAIKAQIQDSSHAIRQRAAATMQQVRELTGMIPLRTNKA